MSLETKEAKLTFSTEVGHSGEVKENSLLTPSRLVEEIGRVSSRFPLLNSGRELSLVGKLGKGGVVLSGGAFAAAVRSPDVIPKFVDLEKNEVVFGGPQTPRMIEYSLGVPIGENAKEVASIIIKNLIENDPRLVSQMFTGLMAIGSEPEAWVIDKKTGDLVAISGGELQEGLLEETLSPIFDPFEFLRERALYTLRRAEKFPDNLILDMSTLITSDPLRPQINIGHNLGSYVYAMQYLLKEIAFSGSDRLAEVVFTQVLRQHGFSSHEELKSKRGDMGYWVMAASHASVGLPHMRVGYDSFFVPAEIAIAVSDIFNSDLASLAELLMFSSPMVFGVSSIQIDGQTFQPYDYRAILRYLMDTTNPSPFIGNVEEMTNRIEYAIKEGLTHTADRASYLTQVGERVFPVMHGRVRNRICSSDPRNQTGRVEFTGCGASPSYYDELARNCFLQILTVAALEAVANNQTPMEYWGSSFPSIASWERQKNIVQEAALYGFNSKDVKELVEEGCSFVLEIKSRYPKLGQIADIAAARIRNLLEEPVGSLEEYVNNPRGPISGVIINEIKKGLSPLELASRIHQFQIELAEKIFYGK